MDETATPPPSTAAPSGHATLSAVWDQFYSYCSYIIRRVPGVRRLSDADREDCVQDVMTEVVRRYGNQHPDDLKDQIAGWIHVLSRNKAADIARRRSRKPEVAFDDGAGEAVMDGSGRTTRPERKPEQAEEVSLVWESLISLEPNISATSYLAFYLRTIEGWDVPEIADLFDLTPEQVRVRCHRVKEKFGEAVKLRSGDPFDDEQAVGGA